MLQVLESAVCDPIERQRAREGRSRCVLPGALSLGGDDSQEESKVIEMKSREEAPWLKIQ